MLQLSKKTILRNGLVALVGLALMSVASTSFAVSLKQIKKRGFARVAVANEIPYGFIGVDGKAKGAGPDVAKAVLKKLGVDQIQWVTSSFGSLIPSLKANRVDMVAAEMAILPPRCQQVAFSIPNSTYGEGLLIRKGNPKDIHSYADFAKRKDLKVAIMSGADQLEMMQKLGVPMSRMVMIHNNADAISAVASGRADAYAATGQTAANLASKSSRLVTVQDFKDPVIDGKEVRSWGAFAFNKASKSFRKAFDKALKAYKHTPEWANTLQGYGFSKTDTKESFKKSVAELCSP